MQHDNSTTTLRQLVNARGKFAEAGQTLREAMEMADNLDSTKTKVRGAAAAYCWVSLLQSVARAEEMVRTGRKCLVQAMEMMLEKAGGKNGLPKPAGNPPEPKEGADHE